MYSIYFLYFRDWQKEALEKLDSQDDRTILFVVDEKGNEGKTLLTKYIVLKKDGIRFENGKSADIKYGYKGERYVCFDLTRSAAEHINWEIIECMKNGIMYNTKYESKMKVYKSPKVVVMMNSLPDKEKLSIDRYKLMHLNCNICNDDMDCT